MDKLISFKGAQYPKSVILFAVYFYVRFPVSYRDLEEIMAERGVNLDHATLKRTLTKMPSQRSGTIPRQVHAHDAVNSFLGNTAKQLRPAQSCAGLDFCTIVFALEIDLEARSNICCTVRRKACITA